LILSTFSCDIPRPVSRNQPGLLLSMQRSNSVDRQRSLARRAKGRSESRRSSLLFRGVDIRAAAPFGAHFGAQRLTSGQPSGQQATETASAT
jgi:hypothetical protein